MAWLRPTVLTALALGLMLAFGAAAGARTIHVALDGQDSADGSAAHPVAGLDAAGRLARPGDTVLVHPGIYRGVQVFRRSGRPGARIVIRPERVGTVAFEGRGTPWNSDLVTIAGSYVTFTGFALRDATRSGISVWEGQGVTISYNTVTGSRRNAIWVGAGTTGRSARNLVTGNVVYLNCLENAARTWDSGWPFAIGIAMSDGTVVERNVVERNYCEGIGLLSVSGVQVRRNVVWDNFSVQIYVDNAPYSVVRHNVIFSTGNSDFYRFGKPAPGVVMANEYARFPLPSRGIVVQDNTLVGVGQIHYSDFGRGGGMTETVITPNDVRSSASWAYLAGRMWAETRIHLAPGLHCGPVILCAGQ
ncbi:right-handed parallel beta-helix repeat-containing protein [Solirhodobacter olei]|uniref:right-handed parallel beta-helix repeat-containing protein n=1 Tax=Solirhodobacter olei TaxID=2493082 RepID=UPI000FD867EA|nr:right-handed parallel beta-helix repeat-containing protein [Solirhodobacter olei]